MIHLPISDTATALLTLGVVVAMFAAFIRERYPTEVVAVGGVGFLLMFGLLNFKDAVQVFSNQAPWTIMAMFILMGGLARTGALDWMTRQALAHAGVRPAATMIGLFALVAASPIFVQLARHLGMPASKVLMPLSFMTILGGMLTMIGTSTNLLVDGVAQQKGLAPFSIFEITFLGLGQLIVGSLYLGLIGRKLLPNRQSMSMLLADRRKMKYFTEVAIPEGSPLIGRNVNTVDAFRPEGVRVIDVLRGDASLRRDMASVVLEAGDRVVLRTEMEELLGLQQNRELRMVDKLSSVQTTTVEVLITPNARMVGRSLGSMRLRRRYGVYPLAVHRSNQNIGRQLDEIVVRVGDTLLLEGAPDDIERLAADMELVDISHPTARAYRRRHAPVAVAALFGVVILAAFDIAPILELAVVACAVILLTRCIDSDEAFSMIDARLMALIFAMLAVGASLESTGAIRLVVNAIEPALSHMPPVLVIFAIFAFASLLTELVSNNAVGVILTPIAIEVARAIGMDPRPLVVAVMFAASASFSTPIGYQTNMLVYGPGGYRFSDYLKVGIPLNILLAIVAATVIPLLWPL
jgi:di/tricarboxylate transporter